MKVFAFDLGNVVFKFDYNIALRSLAPHMKSSAKEVIVDLYENDFGIPFEKGLITADDFYLSFKEKFGLSLEQEQFNKIWCEIFFLQKEMIELIKKIKQKYPIYLISNICQLHYDHLSLNHPDVFGHFNELILSFKVKSVKPELLIYKNLKNIAGVNFEDIIYVDDRDDLIKEASKLKIKSILFTDHPNLIINFKELGIEFA